MKYKTLVIMPEDEVQDTTRINSKKLIDIPDDCGVLLIEDNGLSHIEVRRGGELANHALFLPNKWDWVIGKDSLNATCLMPLSKKEDINKKREVNET